MPCPQPVRSAFSLVEIMVVMTILVVLLSISVPRVTRTIEQAHADMAGASLQSIASAQRFYWLENRTYASSIQDLIEEGLLDASAVVGGARYEYSIVSADAESFTANATRRLIDAGGNPIYDGAWQGAFAITETGLQTGMVIRQGSSYSSDQLQPSY